MEANYEVREPDPLADPSSAWGQRQILLRHGMYRMVRTTRECLMPFFLENIRVLRGPVHSNVENSEEHSEETP